MRLLAVLSQRTPRTLRFFLRRILLGAGLLLAVVLLVFVLIQSVPGDPARLLLSGDSGVPSEEALAAVRRELGLDRSLPAQFLALLTGLFRGDLGTSFVHKQPVLTLLAGRFPNTLEIVGIAAVVSVLLGITIGSLSAAVSARGSTVFATTTSLWLSAPVYVVGTLLVYVVSVRLNWLPAGGFTSWGEDPIRHLKLLVLPVVTISLGLSSIIARATRSAVLETRQQDWVRTARALGHRPARVWTESILRNSLTPVTTLIGLEVGMLMGSTVLVERVFNWPGLSSLLVESVAQRDYPVIQGVILLTAAIFILINILVDYFYTVLDPRARSDA